MDGKNHILGYIGRKIANALEAAADKDQVKITGEIRGIILHPVDKTIGQLPVELIQLPVAGLDSLGEIGISLGKGPHGIVKDGKTVVDERVKQVKFGKSRMFVELTGPSGNIHSLIGNALDICPDLDG